MPDTTIIDQQICDACFFSVPSPSFTATGIEISSTRSALVFQVPSGGALSLDVEPGSTTFWLAYQPGEYPPYGEADPDPNSPQIVSPAPVATAGLNACCLAGRVCSLCCSGSCYDCGVSVTSDGSSARS